MSFGDRSNISRRPPSNFTPTATRDYCGRQKIYGKPSFLIITTASSCYMNGVSYLFSNGPKNDYPAASLYKYLSISDTPLYKIDLKLSLTTKRIPRKMIIFAIAKVMDYGTLGSF